MEKALAFLKGNVNVALSTVENDCPKIRVFQIMKQEGTVFYFATNPKKEIYSQLQQNRHVEFLVMDGNISVRVAGEASLQVADDVAQEIYCDNSVLHRFHDTYRTIAYFSIAALKIDYYDLGTSPITFESYSLI
ncbi:pyridoxamine 5'-phosphate oxidase family protein [Bacteroides eggerthii]|uniref:Pyridoxamine 5'-phosphate oxidase family protein n=1 Tax=Bacteroides eggerthii TaxID=28111 RepID=A0ABT7U795_9BACE|nr:pyridoxamine 5'-phosphate oxidase family protein [Bacteroides eggerthii]